MVNRPWISPAEEKKRMRMRALAGVFTKTNRILTGDRSITCRILDQNALNGQMGVGGWNTRNFTFPQNAPGFSIYPDIWLNSTTIPDINKTSGLVALLGLNYHELSHIMFTPRGYKKKVDRNFPGLGMGYAFNVLEDQRIESFFTALYEPAGKFFTEMFVKFLMEDESAWDKLFMFSYGRPYLPLEIREEFEARFIRPDLIPDVKKCIDEFKSIKSWELRSNSVAVRVIKRFAELLAEVNPPTSDCDGTSQDNGGQVQQSASDEAQQKDRKRKQKEDRTGEDQSNFWDDSEEDEEEENEEASGSDDESTESDGDESPSGGSDDSDSPEDDDTGDGGDGDGDDEESDDEDGGSDSDGAASADSDEDADGEGEGEQSDGSDSSADSDEGEGEEVAGDGDAGPGHSDSDIESNFSDDELREYLDEISEAIEGDESVRSEVGRIQTAMNDNTNIDLIDFGDVDFINQDASASSHQVTRQVTQDFKRLWAEVEPGWKYGSDVGRLNVDRAMMDPDNFDEMFDEWDEGREQDTGLEVFIAVDISSSMMGHEIQLASESMWILKRALDAVDAKTTVVGFHYSTVGLFDRNQTVSPQEWPLWTELGGDTQPVTAMKLGRAMLTTSTLPNKLFVIITDGGWGKDDLEPGEKIEDIVDSIPGTKMYVGVGGGAAANIVSQNHFNMRADIRDTNGMVNLVKKTVESMIRNRVR